MSDDADGRELTMLRAELAQTRELATVSLKAAISALSGLQALLQGIRAESLLGTGQLPEPSLRQAEQHVDRGLSILRAAIEEVSLDSR
ncbi:MULTISPECIES: hypothetical protein [Roseomonadaceae]|uniref:Uncharacterized protein n=1 Tax=Falsiroseomonas oleicola TaxID=2801474 RepID=A0ABS6HAZ1_9PROT|nr:hypothetical protein [Roseomonas oleicola]MBU8545511.1 hypothetical protein [Roseomonas oleicola]